MRKVITKELVRKIFESIPDGVLIFDISGVHIDVNPAFCRMTGFTREELVDTGPPQPFWPPESIRQINQDIDNVLKGDFKPSEQTFMHKNGKRFPVVVSPAVIADNKGNIVTYFAMIRDITEQKKMEEALHEKEARYRELFDNMNSGVAVYEASDNGNDFIIIEFNKAAQRIENIQSDDVIGKSVLEVFPAVREFGLFDAFQRVWKTGKPEQYPMAFYKDSRISGWRENFVYKLPTGDVVAVYEDTTERKLSEVEIQNLAKFPDENPMPVFRIDQEGVLLYINPACEKMLRKSGFIVGQPVPDPWHHDVSDALSSGHLRETEMTVDRRFFLFTIAPILDGGYANIYGYDITERKTAQNELMKSEIRYKSLFMAMNEGFYLSEVIYDEAGNPCDYRYLETNPGFEKMAGLNRNQIIGKRYKELVQIDTTHWLDNYVQVATDGKPRTFSFYSPEYQKHFVTYSYQPEKGKVSVLVIDDTERKMAEEQIGKSLKEKELLLRELYHRTKNNMQVISSMLRIKARSMNEPRISDTFREIENKILSMALVHQKLYESNDLSKINLEVYLKDLVSLFRTHIIEVNKNIEFKTNIKSIDLIIDTAIPLGLVFNELITNSLKHAFPDKRQGLIQLILDVTSGNEVVFEYSDNGIGLHDKFDFTKDANLGLRTVIDLVEKQLNGKIDFYNQNGLNCRIVLKKDLYVPRF